MKLVEKNVHFMEMFMKIGDSWQVNEEILGHIEDLHMPYMGSRGSRRLMNLDTCCYSRNLGGPMVTMM